MMPLQVVLGSQSETNGLRGERGREGLGNQRGPSAEWQHLRAKLEGSGSRDWGRVHNPMRVLAATAPHTEIRLKLHVSQHTRVTEIINKTPGTRGERGERDLTYSYRKVCSQRTGMGREATAHHREPLRSASCELSPGTVVAAADRQRRVRHRETSQNASVSLCENSEQGPRCHCASETREPSPVKVQRRHDCGRRLAPGPAAPAVCHTSASPQAQPCVCTKHWFVTQSGAARWQGSHRDQHHSQRALTVLPAGAPRPNLPSQCNNVTAWPSLPS